MKKNIVIENIDEDLTDTQRMELISHRGGCKCHVVSPCWACHEPLHLTEALELGFIDESEKVNKEDKEDVIDTEFLSDINSWGI